VLSIMRAVSLLMSRLRLMSDFSVIEGACSRILSLMRIIRPAAAKRFRM